MSQDWVTIDQRGVPEEPSAPELVTTGDNAAQLSTLVPKALVTLGQQLDLALEAFPPGSKPYIALQRLKRDAAVAVLTTATRVDETALRQREASVLPRFLEELAKARARLEPKVIEAAPDSPAPR